MTFSSHLVILPVLLPLVVGAFLLLFDERRHFLKAMVSFCSTLALLVIAIVLLGIANAAGPKTGEAITSAYLLGNWAAPFGIVLVLDRLSALMMLLASVLAIAALVFSLARWDRSGPHFHTLFQFLLMGLNGAFLTGDLFNLFVFFEVLLAASYGLALYGSGSARVRAGLHYIVINLVASFFFLIGVALIYGVTGTLNMADLATKVPLVPEENRALLEAGAAILGIAFLVKAGMWPLNFWLPTAYSAAAAPVAAIFSILSKVGVYVVLRLSLLLFGTEAGSSSGFGSQWLVIGGIMTVTVGAFGVLASQAMGRLAGFSVIVSSGTLLAAIGVANVGVTSGALYYLVSSTLALGAFFMLIELLERAQSPAADMLAVTMEAYGDTEEEEVEEEIGTMIPATLATLGICFAVCALIIAGLPPLSGFIGKFALLTAMVNLTGFDGSFEVPRISWVLIGLIVISGLAAMISMIRAGIRTFWAPIDGTVPRVVVLEITPIAFLLAICVGMTLYGGPILRYTDATANSLHMPASYIRDVLHTPTVPSPVKETTK